MANHYSTLNCDFEASFCNWKYPSNTSNTYQWTRITGPTNSQDTGPSHDHTFGVQSGYKELLNKRIVYALMLEDH